VQIYYTKLDGSKYVRTISRKFEVTQDRSQAEANADIAVLGTHAVQKARNISARRLAYMKGTVLSWKTDAGYCRARSWCGKEATLTRAWRTLRTCASSPAPLSPKSNRSGNISRH
jgi:hypothetical protein